jgi:hypothetical protein
VSISQALGFVGHARQFVAAGDQGQLLQRGRADLVELGNHGRIAFGQVDAFVAQLHFLGRRVEEGHLACASVLVRGLERLGQRGAAGQLSSSMLPCSRKAS